MALRFPFAEFSHSRDGCLSDRVMDQRHHRCEILVQSTGGPGGNRTHDLPIQSRKLCL